MQIALISAVMGFDFLNLAIANASERFHFDQPDSLRPNGDADNSCLSSSF